MCGWFSAAKVALVVKNPPSNARDVRDPWVGKIPWRRKWQPTPVFFPGESHRQRSPVSCSPWGHKESDTTKVTYCEELACALTQAGRTQGLQAGGPGPGAENQGRCVQGQKVGVQQSRSARPLPATLVRPPPPLSPLLQILTSSGHAQKQSLSATGPPRTRAHWRTKWTARTQQEAAKLSGNPDVWPRCPERTGEPGPASPVSQHPISTLL